MSAEPPPPAPSLWRRAAGACGAALAGALCVYLLLQAIEPDFIVLGVLFGALPPAALCAFIAYMIDLRGQRPLVRYLMVPVVTALVMLLIWRFVHHQGLVFLAVSGAIWLFFGMLGSLLTFICRRAVPGAKI